MVYHIGKERFEMKFTELEYQRLDVESAEKELKELCARMRGAKTYAEAKEVFIEKDNLYKHIATCMDIASIRHDIDTRDAFYDEESKFWKTKMPEISEVLQEFTKALLDSPFRAEFEAEYGNVMFINGEIEMKSFSPAIIEEMKEESLLANEYEDLLASAQIPFEDGVYTLSQMTPFMNDPDDARRLAAWKATGQWYKDHQPKMDEIYDELVKRRDAMGRKLGYDGYTQLGYYRMNRNSYTKEDVEKFREAVVKYVVPIAEKIYRRQAVRLGVPYPLSFADEALEFRSGNPKPQGTAEDIVKAGTKFYDELSPETSEFFHTMLDCDLMSLLSTEGKRGGGYCTGLADYHVPFIFANFNGTQDDVEVVTHEAGHAFAAWMNRFRVPYDSVWPTMESCEVHSISMEFFAEGWAEDFFGKDAKKYLYSHLAGGLTFIPYGTMVDHFQHEVYAHPEMTPRQRHDTWKRLMGIYMPWIRLDGEIPFFAEGEHWQLKHHIYSSPFYYIDYCLAHAVALEFWAMIQEDRENAWNHYMRYTEQGGSKVFTELLKGADLESPFEGDMLRKVCEKADAYLDAFDLSGIR